jgi:hypothetical protein
MSTRTRQTLIMFALFIFGMVGCAVIPEIW